MACLTAPCSEGSLGLLAILGDFPVPEACQRSSSGGQSILQTQSSLMLTQLLGVQVPSSWVPG